MGLTLTEGSRHWVALRVNDVIMAIDGATQRHLGNKMLPVSPLTNSRSVLTGRPRLSHLVNEVVLRDHRCRFPWIAIDVEAPPTDADYS